MAYPLNDPNPVVFQEFTRQLEVSYAVQSDYNTVRGPCSGRSWEAILHGLHHIHLIYGKKYDGAIFTDCLSLNYEAAIFAALLNFATVNCIAVRPYEEGDDEILQKYQDSLKGHVRKVCGRFQDYFVEDSDVVYIDLFVLGDFLDQDLSYIVRDNPADWILLFSEKCPQGVQVYIFEKLQ